MRHALALSSTAFVLHFVWESLQCPVFYVHGSYVATRWGMVMAALGDVVLTWVVYGAVAGVSGAWTWSASPWRGRQWLVLAVTAAAIAVAVEARANVTGRWSYKPGTPLIPGTAVSLIPVLQMLLLSPLAFAIARHLSRSGAAPRSRGLA